MAESRHNHSAAKAWQADADRYRRILAVLTTEQEPVERIKVVRATLHRREAELDELKSRGRVAIRRLQAIDPTASPDVIMYGVKDALRAMNRNDWPPRQNPPTDATPP